MAKTSKYSDEQLLSAVERYAELFKGKISATDLAKWANVNVPALRGVKYYHFIRPLSVTNPKTGKKEQVKRPCTQRLEEINASRDFQEDLKRNPLFYSSTLEDFFALPVNEQKQWVLEARRQMDVMNEQRRTLTRENQDLRTENKQLRQQVENQSKETEEIRREIDLINKRQKLLNNVLKDTEQRKMLASIGIEMEKLNVRKFIDSMQVHGDEVFHIDQAVKKMESDPTGFISDGMDWDDE